MILPDTFLTLSQSGESEIKEKGSRFIGFAQRIVSEENLREWVKRLRKEHPSAAHVCWAFVGGYSANEEVSSDDREPSGSAGKPILKAIRASGLTFTGVAVVRYFGGKLLGVPGLISAYSTAAAGAIQHSGIAERKVAYKYYQPSSFERQHEVIRICKKQRLKFFPDHQNGSSGITFEVSPSAAEEVLRQLSEQRFSPANRLTIMDY